VHGQNGKRLAEESREAQSPQAAIKDVCDGHVQKEKPLVTIMYSCCPRCKYLGCATGRTIESSSALWLLALLELRMSSAVRSSFYIAMYCLLYARLGR